MQLLSTTISLTRYRVDGELGESFMDAIRSKLKDNTIREIDNDPAQKSVGWTCPERPFNPDFDAANMVFGTSLVFSLRIDKKSIPTKIVNKHVNMAVAKRMADTERDQLSKNEKKQIKDEVIHRLYMRVPATPNIYDLVWHYEAGELWFFSNQKEANEELETLFSQAFRLTLIRIFPYTAADLLSGLSDAQRDTLQQVAPTAFYGGAHA